MPNVQSATAELFDRKLPELQAAAAVLRARPPKGWIYGIRTALGLSSAAFAKLLKVSQPAAFSYEKGEIQGSLTLSTLERIAEALDAQLVVALIPRKPIAKTLRTRAEAIAHEEIRAVVRTMQLEDQEVDEESTREAHEKLIETLLASPKKLWR